MKKCTRCLKVKEIVDFYKIIPKDCFSDDYIKFCSTCKICHNKLIKMRKTGSYNRRKTNQLRKNRYKNDSLYKLKISLRSRIYGALKRNKFVKKSKSLEILGGTYEEIRKHLESQFIDGMTWANHGHWHIDHIVPLSSAKTEEEMYKLCHYKNLQPLWAVDNLKKGNRIL